MVGDVVALALLLSLLLSLLLLVVVAAALLVLVLWSFLVVGSTMHSICDRR